jgi:hypothetical protein
MPVVAAQASKHAVPVVVEEVSEHRAPSAVQASPVAQQS